MLALLIIAAGSAHAQAYPTKPVRLIVPFVPGGETDIVARALASRLMETFGQSVVVDNKAGAGGTIGAEIVARSIPDGYTLLMVSASYAASPIFRKLPYDPVNDIQPISQVAESPFLIAVHPSIPAKNVKELIALAKAKPGALSYGSAGGITRLASELFKLDAKVNLGYVPYKGTSPMLTDLISGQIQLTFGNMFPTLREVKAGKLRGIAVTSRNRSRAAPDIPTVAESGVPTYEVAMWYGMIGPRGLPEPIVSHLNSVIVKAIKTQELQNRFGEWGLDPIGSTPEELRALLGRDIAKWAWVVKATDINCPVWPFC